MDPIPAETIEQADDFIFRLSTNQTKDWLDNLKKNQPALYMICENNANNASTPEGIEYINRIQLTVFHSFRYYGITPYQITEKEIEDCANWFFNKINSLPEQDDDSDIFLRMGAIIEQHDLVNYIIDKIDGAEDLLKSSKGLEEDGFIAMCIIITTLYSQKIKRRLPASTN